MIFIIIYYYEGKKSARSNTLNNAHLSFRSTLALSFKAINLQFDISLSALYLNLFLCLKIPMLQADKILNSVNGIIG